MKDFPKTIFRADDVGGAIKGKHVDRLVSKSQGSIGIWKTEAGGRAGK